MIQCLCGLKALHELQVMHRDIKCANILISARGECKLADFNVSKVVNHNEGFLHTQTGTPYYASPEVWKDRPYDFKSDIWSLGCVLYEMAALRPPFKAKMKQAEEMQMIQMRAFIFQVSAMPAR